MESPVASVCVRRRSGWIFRDKRTTGQVIFGIAYFDVNGRLRKERTNAENKTLARRILAERENAVEKARLQRLPSVDSLVKPKPAITLRQYADDYKKHIDAHCAPETARRYRNGLDVNILPKLGSKTLQEITPGHVQRYADERLKAEAARATVRQEMMILSGLFREALKEEIVDRNPVRLTSKPRVENEIVRYLDEDEEKRVLGYTKEPLRSAIIVAIHSGLRESEQLNLTWADVRFGKGASDSFIVVRHTKSKRDRVVPMSQTLYDTLDGIDHHVSSPYVFTNTETGTRFERFNADGWRAALKHAGVVKFRWHDLRHTFGSRLAQRGVSIVAIKELLGHSSITVTMRYAHLSPSNLRQAVEALDAILGESATHCATQTAPAEEKKAG